MSLLNGASWRWMSDLPWGAKGLEFVDQTLCSRITFFFTLYAFELLWRTVAFSSRRIKSDLGLWHDPTNSIHFVVKPSLPKHELDGLRNKWITKITNIRAVKLRFVWRQLAHISFFFSTGWQRCFKESQFYYTSRLARIKWQVPSQSWQSNLCYISVWFTSGWG